MVQKIFILKKGLPANAGKPLTFKLNELVYFPFLLSLIFLAP